MPALFPANEDDDAAEGDSITGYQGRQKTF